jgi:thiol:disulfide interchange protein
MTAKLCDKHPMFLSMKGKLIVVCFAAIGAISWLSSERAKHNGGTGFGFGFGGNADWMTDAPAALARAKQENKTVLINFTGSDWCGWCIKLDEEVFSTSEFRKYASKNLVLLKIDFPRSKTLPASEQSQNEGMLLEYRVNGFPTIVVLGPDGKERGRMGYRPGGATLWLASLDKLR